jgi:hypothetical protein
MGRSVIGACAVAGGIIGGAVPDLWGAGAFSLSSVFLSAVGGLAGVWLGARISEV